MHSQVPQDNYSRFANWRSRHRYRYLTFPRKGQEKIWNQPHFFLDHPHAACIFQLVHRDIVPDKPGIKGGPSDCPEQFP